MKKSRIIALVVFMFLCLSGYSQQRSDFKGHVIDSKGDVYLDGVPLGHVTKGGEITDIKGKKVATVNGDGSVTDSTGKKIGRVGKNNENYSDAGGNVVMTVEPENKQTCAIKDSKGKVIGNVHDSYKGMACATHCLSNQMDMKNHEKIKK